MTRLFVRLLLTSFTLFAAACAHRPADMEQPRAVAPESRYLMVYMSDTGKQRPDEPPKETQVVLSDADGRNPVTITSGQLLHLYPRIDAPGRKVALAEGADDRTLSIIVKDLNSGIVEQWTPADGMNIHPRFSGNGRYLAFSGPLGPGKRAQIGIIDMEAARKSGVQERNAQGLLHYEVSPRIIGSEYESYFPALSSDGSFLVFQQTKGKTEKEIVLLDLTNNHMEKITKERGEWKSPSLSFDDRWIAYTGAEGGNWDIYLTNRVTKETKRATHGNSRELSPAFRPDGSLVFSSDRHGHFELYEIPAEEMENGSFQERPLLLGEGQHYAPSVSGDVTLDQARLPDMPEPGRSSFGAVRAGSRVYIAGGHQGHGHYYPKDSFLSKFEYFDLAEGKWHAAAPLLVPCQGFGLASSEKYIYAFGGFAYSEAHKPAWQSLDIIQRYDIQNDRWEEIGRMPRPRSSYALAQVGTKVYLLGGWDGTPKTENDEEGRFYPEVDVFDLITEKMTPDVARVPAPLRRALSAAVLGKDILLLGGLSPGATHFEFLDNVTAFNPESGVWRELPRLPFATFAPAAGVLGDRLFIFGGMFKTGPERYDYVNHIFTLDRGARWVHTGRYLGEPKGFSQVVDLGPDALGIIGGQSNIPAKDTPVLTFESFGLAHGLPR